MGKHMPDFRSGRSSNMDTQMSDFDIILNDEDPSHLIGQSPWTSDQAVFDVSKAGGLIFKISRT